MHACVCMYVCVCIYIYIYIYIAPLLVSSDNDFGKKIDFRVEMSGNVKNNFRGCTGNIIRNIYGFEIIKMCLTVN